MELSKFQAVAKKRSGWASIDLGFVMAQAWFFKLWLLWLLPAALCLVFFSIIFSSQPMYAGLIAWWLKPIWERPLLHVASRQIFGETLSFPQAFRSVLSSNKKDWFWWFTLRRLFPTRAYIMPVTVLEGLSGKARSQRVSLLTRKLSSPAAWLTIGAVHIEVFINLAILTGIMMLIPSGVELELETVIYTDASLQGHIYNVIWLICASVIAPFYVCAGFSLYLQRRIDLEAWDIEIQFRQLAERLHHKRRSKASTMLGIGVLASCFYFTFDSNLVMAQGDRDLSNRALSSKTLSNNEQVVDTQMVPSVGNGDVPLLDSLALDTVETEQPFLTPDYASDAALPIGERASSKERIHEILSNEPFLNEITKSQFVLKEKTEDQESGVPEWLINFIEWLEGSGDFFSWLGAGLRFIAQFIEFILWGAVILILALVVWRRRKWMSQLFTSLDVRSPTEQAVAPKALFGINLEEEPLPDDLLGRVNEMWRSGRSREAFALLMRAVILLCVDRNCSFKDGYTELECAEVVRNDLGGRFGSEFMIIIRQWQQIAYAHRTCSDEQFAELCAIYEGWVDG